MGDAGGDPPTTRPCGCVHRYQSVAKHQIATRSGRQRSQSATPLRTPGVRSYSRPTTPTSTQSSQLTEELRSLSETHLNDHVEVTILDTNSGGGAGRSSRSRSTHWSRRSPEDLARLARLRNSSRSPVSRRETAAAAAGPGSSASSTTTWGSRPGSQAGARGTPGDRNRHVGTGYGHSYSLPRPFDTTPTGAERAPAPSPPAAKFERSRAPSQSGASYYRGRTATAGRAFGAFGCGCCGSGCRGNHQQQGLLRAMSEASLVNVDGVEEVVEEVVEVQEVAAPSARDHQQPRYVSECRLEPRFVATAYGSSIACRSESTWRRFTETVHLEKCLVSVRPPSPSPPSPPPRRRYRAALEVRVRLPPPEGRPPIGLGVHAAA